MNFLENLQKQCLTHGFRSMGGQGDSIFSLAKEENTTLCFFHVIDLSKVAMDDYLSLRYHELHRVESLAPLYSNILVIFLSVGENPPPVLNDAEGYYGQSPYTIYWHVNPHSREITVPKDQPNDMMGLMAMIKEILNTDQGIQNLDDADLTQVESSTNDEYISDIFPFCTLAIVAVNVLILVLMYQQGFATEPFLVAARFGAIIPGRIWGAGEYYRLLTAMFIHFGWMHLVFNVAGMLIFGTRIERYYGKGNFLAIYFISGLVASVASLLLTQGFSAGASGAVYGLVGAAFVYTKYKNRKMDIISSREILFYIVIGLVMSFVMPNIDYFGHIGGLVAGLFTGFVALKLKFSVEDNL